MVLAQKAVLSRVAKWVKLVAPVTSKIEPRSRCARVKVGCNQSVRSIVVLVRVHVHDGIPERTTVSHIVQNATGQDVWMYTCCRVHGVGTGGREADGLGMLVSHYSARTIDSPSVHSSLQRPMCTLHQSYAH